MLARFQTLLPKINKIDVAIRMSWHANFGERIGRVGTFIPDLRITL